MKIEKSKLLETIDIPIHIKNVINNRVEEIFKANNEEIDKRTLRLGMMDMYLFLKNANKLK